MKNVFAEVITIGDELLYGQTLDTNSHWMSGQLSDAGISIIRKTSVGDIGTEIAKSLEDASQRADIVLITGGLGPTKDDITKKILAEYFGTQLVMNQQAISEVTAYFARRNRQMTDTNAQQAMLPANCTMVSNTVGTAPGMWFEHHGTIFMSMPGVPHEMKTMMERSVIPMLKQRFQLPVIFHQMIQTVGIGESWLSDQIESWEANLPSHIKLAYLPQLGRVKLRLTAFGDHLQQLEEEVNEQVAALVKLVGEYIYGYGELSLEEAIGQLLVSQGKTIATAESCTGGHLAHTITSIAGSSAYFRGGIIPYSNDLKMKMLQVKNETLQNYGAVSEPTVIEMADAIRALYRADIGVSTSGIAGPGGGTPEKPVGTVWIAVSHEKGTITKKLSLSQDRTLNIQYTTVNVLNLLRSVLKG